MALKPQNPDGTVNDANAYGSVAGLLAYWSDRGVDLSSRPVANLESSLILSTDYVDARYKFVGYQAYRTQGTQFPRNSVTTRLRGIPPALLNAVFLLAKRVLDGKVLMPDPTHNASGQAVSSKKVKVGPIETDYSFAASASSRPEETLPMFPDVDLVLKSAGLLASLNSGVVLRG